MASEFWSEDEEIFDGKLKIEEWKNGFSVSREFILAMIRVIQTRAIQTWLNFSTHLDTVDWLLMLLRQDFYREHFDEQILLS